MGRHPGQTQAARDPPLQWLGRDEGVEEGRKQVPADPLQIPQTNWELEFSHLNPHEPGVVN